MEDPTLLPQSVESERHALSACLVNPLIIPTIMGIATPDDYYRPQYRVIARALQEMFGRDELPDITLLRAELERTGKWDAAGGAEYVNPLGYAADVSDNAESHAERIWRMAELRRHIQEAGRYAAEAYKANDPDVVLTAHMERIAKLGKRSRAGFVDLADALDDAKEDILNAMDTKHPNAIFTGLPDLDRHLKGFRPGEMAIICARPGQAKSSVGAAFAVGEAEHLEAMGVSGTVAWVTLEMSQVQQAKRVIAAAAGINTRQMRGGFLLPNGEIHREGYRKFDAAWKEIRARLGRRVRLLDTPVSLSDLRTKLMREKAEYDTKVMFLDQFDLLEPEQWSVERRQAELERLNTYSRGLKLLARSLDIVVVVLVQLNRESTKNVRPDLTHLAGTDRLGRDADIVMACHRPSEGDPERARDDIKFREFLELNLLKVRDGEASVTIPARFEKEYTRVSSWPYGGEESWPSDDSRHTTTSSAAQDRGFYDFGDAEM